MADRTLTAMYDTRDAAESARDDLVGLGIPSANVTIRTDADMEHGPYQLDHSVGLR